MHVLIYERVDTWLEFTITDPKPSALIVTVVPPAQTPSIGATSAGGCRY